jgi:uncharacterized membrane protein
MLKSLLTAFLGAIISNLTRFVFTQALSYLQKRGRLMAVRPETNHWQKITLCVNLFLLALIGLWLVLLP